MKIIEVKPKDVEITIKFTLTELYLLQQYMGRCTCTLDIKRNPFLEKARTYVEIELMGIMNDLIGKLLDGNEKDFEDQIEQMGGG